MSSQRAVIRSVRIGCRSRSAAETDLEHGRAPVDEYFSALDGDQVGEDFDVPEQVRASVYVEERILGVERWESAVALANSTERPPLTHILLAAARSALDRAEYRRAVLDAVSACEVALAGSLQAHLADQRQEVVAELLRGARGIDRLHQLHRKIVAPVEGVTTDRLRKELATPRNHVVHAGAKPNAEEARDVVRFADEVVRFLSPSRIP
jgi:hypothetical protein